MNSFDILVPHLPESVNTAQVVKWHKNIGDIIEIDEILVEIETDKIILEVPAISSGILHTIFEAQGSIVRSQQILGKIKHVKNVIKKSLDKIKNNISEKKELNDNKELNIKINDTLSPKVRRLVSCHNIKDFKFQGTGVNNRITPQDIEIYMNNKNKNNENNQIKYNVEKKLNHIYERTSTKIKMSNVRKCIAKRLLSVKQNTAILTTFNEVNMKPIIKLREKYGEEFKEKYGVKLGFMSFYVKAVIEGLKRFPEINAMIDKDEIIQYHYYDISIAVSTSKGLVTPILKDANLMSMSEIEKKIKKFAIQANESKLSIEDLTGGNFTITNGGIFGSLFSTPIINPPQSAILALHNIKNRPVVLDNKICIRPMMYIALSYDHRIIDGKEAVGFLVNIKKILEDFNRIILHI
ncbi:2-oxoglutarate dehydrogenase complex dihydrolipoyllysine-residue succinyltransferase [Buchnera aphidicola (Pemphigus obesinymphae)]|uniref:2-oxoglutarate dehydrogenase complex dihydrolipoyllysine-residue succinyltransferase n=1 Tax=Buchnera aphidicola TaxID=9 RepID=UPI0022382703|nr:2-oxoglutarate dehydrogenase complex dihydrolipoyllysine-residue succinyltransferase [Buchnera aphidicola]MCW5196824.1 2-oxoglutarate dehydrogenase complex dihydrolipoyllysine-residue succinyltransferase [Buchnera aphidicola (Pemphigus obesinymphae)]